MRPAWFDSRAFHAAAPPRTDAKESPRAISTQRHDRIQPGARQFFHILAVVFVRSRTPPSLHHDFIGARVAVALEAVTVAIFRIVGRDDYLDLIRLAAVFGENLV